MGPEENTTDTPVVNDAPEETVAPAMGDEATDEEQTTDAGAMPEVAPAPEEAPAEDAPAM